ncbi:MAG: hypothetical protein JSR67_00065 [Proteobacteria bacterium]|nr:hypothetical protein [Pseudomonadota bacterium]
MRPLAALIAILTGSAVALTAGLTMTWMVILLMPAQEARFAPEQPALLKAIGVFALLSAASGLSFYGEQRHRAWRGWAHLATIAAFALAVWAYWPR